MNWRRPFGQWVLNRRQPLTACGAVTEPLRLPLDCANCNQPSTQAVRCPAPGTSTTPLLIPYCSRCHQTLEAGKTRVLLSVCGALVLGACALLVVPLCALDVSMLGYALVASCVSVAPLLAGVFVKPRRLEGQSSADTAIWVESRVLVGTNVDWMTRLALDNHGQVSSLEGRTNSWPRSAWIMPLLFSALALGMYNFFYPTLVVLNLSAGEFELWVDGRMKANVGVSSLESTDAARRVTLPAGHHHIEAKLVGEGEVIQSANVDLDALQQYLFAPGARGHCFWTEAVTYGKTQTKPEKQRLGGKDGFMALPARIDTWFASNPPTNDDRKSSGGEMVALRHGRCDAN